MSRKYVWSEDYIIRIIRYNILKRGIPIHLPRWAIEGWVNRVRITRSKGYFIYTGLMYQMAPFIEELVNKLVWLNNEYLMWIGSKLNRVFDITRLFANPPKYKVDEAHEIISNIYMLLRRQGVDVWYEPNLDSYSGALLHEFGLDEELAIHGSRTLKKLESHGIEKIVTIDPHTHYIFKVIYPELVDGFDLETYNYIELLESDRSYNDSNGPIYTIHDPCYYARASNMWSKPRELLGSLGIKFREARFCRANTYCCGGPIESLAPIFSARIGERRLRQLMYTGAEKIIVMCPICLANLNRVSGSKNVVDLSLVLARFI